MSISGLNPTTDSVLGFASSSVRQALQIANGKPSTAQPVSQPGNPLEAQPVVETRQEAPKTTIANQPPIVTTDTKNPLIALLERLANSTTSGIDMLDGGGQAIHGGDNLVIRDPLGLEELLSGKGLDEVSQANLPSNMVISGDAGNIIKNGDNTVIRKANGDQIIKNGDNMIIKKGGKTTIINGDQVITR
ncbi:MAG TPA: hypothetical protein V6C52_07860 [Coleofasciculaceae cyanobacterium]